MDALARIKQTRLPFAELLGIEVVSAFQAASQPRQFAVTIAVRVGD